MKKSINLMILIGFAILLLMTFRYMDFILHPENWGWPIPTRLKGITIFIILIISIVLAIWIFFLKTSSYQKNKLLVLLEVTAIGAAIFIEGFILFAPDIEQEISKMGYNQDNFGDISFCKQFEILSSVEYRSLNMTPSITLAPEWIQNTLEQAPNKVAISCIVELGMVQLRIIGDDKYANEIAVAKIHSLVFVAYRLSLIYSPELIDFLEIVLSNKKTDPFNLLQRIYCAPLEFSIDELEVRKIDLSEEKFCSD